MIDRLSVVRGDSFDPYRNLAAEQVLLERCPHSTCTLYLWQNQNTVVIGRNQNAWRECRTDLLTQEGGHLARRPSGGGAVYHDLGNLNFTFVTAEADYDLPRQLSVIARACASFGIPAEFSGRNDLLADGRKFSGSAFCHRGERALHHGTLLVCVDTDRMMRYLAPGKAKLAAKGVDSVRSRVVNLQELSPSVTVDTLSLALIEAFAAVYGTAPEMLPCSAFDAQEVEAFRQKLASPEWIYGQHLPFTFSCEGRYPFGEIQLQLQIQAGFVCRAAVYSDAMDPSFAPRLAQLLTGCEFSREALQARVSASGLEYADRICTLLAEQEI
jgi:lipoate-protein ligase A